MATRTYSTTYRSARPGYRPSLETGSQEGRCGQCGKLECLCRPRFFAGQLLTEDDLNRLDQYIVKKQRLHNRHLHGWGVVCGLELECGPCGKNVIVTSGYALSPCGEDIVVCEDDTVDVCKLIQECLDQERSVEPCEPPRYRVNEECKDAEEAWLLMIRYEEHSTRGITALRNATAEARCRPCDCGSSGGCDCSNTEVAKTQLPKQWPRPQPAQCEPTVVCEGYRYEVCRASVTDMEIPGPGDWWQRAQAFSKPFVDFFSALAGKLNSATTSRAMYQVCCSAKATLADLLVRYASQNCRLAESLATLPCPDPNKVTDLNLYRTQLDAAIGYLVLQILLDCWCTAWLPPCRTSNDPRVVLGRVTVRRNDCKVLRICNWTSERKFVTTFPNLQYWLSFIYPFFPRLVPLLRGFRRLYLERLCCGVTKGERVPSAAGPTPTVFGSDIHMAQATVHETPVEGLLKTAFDMLTIPVEALAKLQQAITDTGMAESLSPLEELFSGLGAAAAPAEEVEKLKVELSELKEASETQKRQLDELIRQMGRKKK